MNYICNLFKKKNPKRSAAGILFTDNTHVLAGYQPTKKTPIISGFGGMIETGEDWQTASVRELLEELFDITSCPSGLIQQIKELLYETNISLHISISDNYTYATYLFSDLEKILQIVSDSSIQSPIYPHNIPLTITDLIFKRIYTPKSEIQQLVLLPLEKNIKLDPLFINDINSQITY